VVGAVVTVMLAIFELYLIHQPSTDALIRSNHLSMYWVETNRRMLWPLMFAAGFVGAAGLWRLARRGVIVPFIWVGVCAVIGTAGVFDQTIPVWYRFILLYQVPLAAATAVVIAQLRPSATRIVICATLALSVSFKLATLVLSPVSVTYGGTAIQASWQLGRDIPAGSGLIASDPFTSYFIPAATGHRTLTVTKAHTGSQPELDASNSGYLLLRRFAAGGSDDWWSAAQTMWRRGVRYVVVEKWTRIAAPDLTSFSTGPTPLIRTPSDRSAEGTYFYRLNRVGHLIHDDSEFAIYQLDGAKLA
jgi:hypothetical protein